MQTPYNYTRDTLKIRAPSFYRNLIISPTALNEDLWLLDYYLTGSDLSDWPSLIWLCFLEGNQGLCRGQLNLDGQVTGTAGQWLWAPGTARLPAKGLYNHRFMRATAQSPVNLANEDAQTGPLWLVSLYCLIAFHDTGIPGVMILAGNNWSLSLSVVSAFPTWTDSEKEILCPLPVWLLQPSALGNRIFLSSQTDRLSFHLYENKEVELNDLSSFPIFCSFFSFSWN